MEIIGLHITLRRRVERCFDHDFNDFHFSFVKIAMLGRRLCYFSGHWLELESWRWITVIDMFFYQIIMGKMGQMMMMNWFLISFMYQWNKWVHLINQQNWADFSEFWPSNLVQIPWQQLCALGLANVSIGMEWPVKFNPQSAPSIL